MTVIGALAFGIFSFFAVGLYLGQAPRVRLLEPRPKKAEVSNRQIWLTQAGLDLTPKQFYGGLGAVGLAVFAIMVALTGTPVTAIAPAVAVVMLPYAFFSRRRAQSMSKTQQAWPDAILELIASIESNASLHGALVQLSHRGPEALRDAFDRFPSMASTSGVVPALESVRERLSDPTSDRVIEVLILAHERGGNIVTDILRDLAANTTEDLQLQDEIETSQLEQKINGRAVFVMPWATLILLTVTSTDFKSFYRSPAGYLVVLIGLGLSCFGIWLVSHLGKDTPELRVFGGSAVSEEAK